MKKSAGILFIIFVSFLTAAAQNTRILSGIVLTPQFELVPSVSIEVRTSEGKLQTETDAAGRFELQVPAEPLSVKFSGKNLAPQTRIFAPTDVLENLQIKISYLVPPVSASVTISANVLSPTVTERNETVYKSTLVGRDDQIIQSLTAGINAGQHEGGGKSLEIRRFGFNLDHGGVGGGLKILVDNFPQNQATQGHGQGYLGNLKSLTPELVSDVSIINGPFSAAYGDFSGLGVVQIHLRESLPQVLTARIQAGSFDTLRAFLAYSPEIKQVASFIAYEPSVSDGPFKNPLRYRRDNLTGNLIRRIDDGESLGFKLNFGRNDFTSSGQIPLDEVFARRLDRFGFVDPDSGGRVRAGTIGAFYRKEWSSGKTFKADAFLSRSLFDLFSNFTFYLADPIYGDEIQQHDSRLQQSANAQYLHPYKFFGRQALVTAGVNFHFSQINVGLYPSIHRAPNRKFLPENINNPNVLLTSARAKINNYAGYAQNSIDFFHGHLRIEAGLRWDYFTFDVNGFEHAGAVTALSGKEGAARLQPKFSLAWSPFEKFPTVFYFNYGRGISSQDARGVVRHPQAPKISTTDFYQAGAGYNAKRFSAAASFFLIDRSNEQVYIPDDGSIELAGRSRSSGFEIKTSAQINRFLSFSGSLTQVVAAFYPGQFTADLPPRRIIVDSAPHTTASANLILSELGGFNSSLSWRHISSYRLDGEDESVRAAGNDVLDFSLSKRVSKRIELNFSIDNVLNKRYWETQNYFESRLLTDAPLGFDPLENRNVYPSRIHATPGYPITFNFGVTLRLGNKQ